MNDWNTWLNSNETRTALKLLSEASQSVVDDITDGSLLIDKPNLSVEYAKAMGVLEGIRETIYIIKDIERLTKEEE